MKNYIILNLHKRDMTFRKIDKKSIAFLLVFVLIFTMLFAMTSIPVTYAADKFTIYGGGGGGGGGGGAAEGSTAFGLGGTGTGTNNDGGDGAVGLTGRSGGGGGGGGRVDAPGQDADYSTGGAAGLDTNSIAKPGDNGTSGAGVIGGAGGRGSSGYTLYRGLSSQENMTCSGITLVGGPGGNGGQQVIDETTGRLSGPGGKGGNGGNVGINVESAPKLDVFTSILVKSGIKGQDGNGDGEQNGIGGDGGYAGLKLNTILNTPNIVVEKNDGDIAVEIKTLDVTSNTSITAQGTSADEFVITNVNVSSGGILTIYNSEGDLSIGTLNIAEGGKVIVTNPTPNAADPANIVGDETFKLKKGYKTTYSKAFTISGFPEATISIDNDYDGKIIWNHDVNKFYISEGLDIGSYPINITVSNGVNEESSMQFTVIVGENLTPTNNNSPTDQTDGKSPQTNDSSEILLWIIIECMVLIGIGLYVWQALRRINI